MLLRTLSLLGLLLTGCAVPPSGAGSQLATAATEPTKSVAVATAASGAPGATTTTQSASTPAFGQSAPTASSAPTSVGTTVPATGIPTAVATTINGNTPAAGSAPATATISSGASTSTSLAPTELKYRLIQQYGVFYCAAGGSPPTSNDESDRAVASFPTIQKDAEIFRAILEHNQLSGLSNFSTAQKLLVYRDYQQLGLVKLDPAGGGVYAFSLRTNERLAGVVLSGTISPQGLSVVSNRQPVVNRCSG